MIDCQLDKDATDYFRAIVKAGELSARVLELTESIIRMNPAHYSAWCVLRSAAFVRELNECNVGSTDTRPSLRLTRLLLRSISS